ncbi:MAG TPA: hypothetical protein VLG47_04010 [Candidatus Saccharimonadales bacterium]|nr:hypothetical protein [Candidatus Saccharimonadales bacterium]
MSSPAGPNAIPLSVLQLQEGAVTHVYEMPGGRPGEADMASAIEAQLYLDQRLVDDSQGPQGWAFGMTEGTVPVPFTMPREVHEVSRLRRAEGYWVTRKAAAIVMLSSLAVCAMINNRPIGALVQNAEIGLSNLFDHAGPTETPIIAHGKTVPISVDIRSKDKSGVSRVDPQAVEKFRDKVRAELDRGGKGSYIEEMGSAGEASDEGYAGIGVADPAGQGNDKLAHVRADKGAAEARTAFGHEPIPTIDVTWSQDVLKPRQKAKLEKLAQKAGYTDLDAAIAALDAGKPIDAKLAKKLTAAFLAHRGDTLSAKVFEPGKDKVIGEKVTPGEGLPYDDVNGWKPFFIPMIPIRRREWYKTQRQRWLPRIGWKPGFRLPRLYKFEQDEENVLVRVRPEAIQEDNTLVDMPWRMERKHEHELRDGLVTQVLRADWKDKTDKDQSMRLTFVNFTPTPETLELYGEALKIFAASHDETQVTDIISNIFVYPSEDAGTAHEDPSRISVGGDKQDPPSVLGHCLPLMEEIEMHMPATLDPAELAAIFDDFVFNPVGTLGHELTHGATAVPDKQTLRQVVARGIRRAMRPVGPRWLNPMAPVAGEVLPQHMQYAPDAQPLQFRIRYLAADADHNISTIEETVDADDSRLGHMLDAEIVGYQITRYSGTNDQENGAEVGLANVIRIVQDQRIPFTEAGVHVALRLLDSGETGKYADGYNPDPRAQAALARHMGANPDVFPFEFSDPPEVTITAMDPEDDPVIRQATIDSRSRRFLAPDDMVAVLAGVRR